MYAERKYEHNNDKIRLIVFKCHITYLLQKIVYMFILLFFWIMRYGYNYNEIYKTCQKQNKINFNKTNIINNSTGSFI